jgi:hypothetical protein
LPLTVLVAIAVLVRIVAWMRTPVLFNDGPVFLSIAEAVGEGRWGDVLAHPYHPLYPACIHLFSTSGLSPENAAIAVSIFGAAIGIIALHALLRRAFGLDIAWLGAWMLALHPWAVDFSADVMSDGLYLGLFLASFAAMARMVEEPNTSAASSFAVFTVLAYLVRPEALGLMFAGALLVSARAVHDEDVRRAAVRPVAVFTIVAGLGLAPYVGLLTLEAGELTLTQKKSVAALARGDSGPTTTATHTIRSSFDDKAIWLPQSARPPDADQPPRDLGGALEAVFRVVRTSSAALRYEVLLLVVIGVLIAHREERAPWRTSTFVLPVLLYSGLLVLLVWGAGYVSRRHALPAVIPLLGFAALAWKRLGQAAISCWERRAVAPGNVRASIGPRPPLPAKTRARILCGALVVALALAWIPRDLRERRSDRVALREAAEWIGSTFSSPGPVAAEKLRMAYYAGAAYVPLAAGVDESLEASLTRSGVAFVLVDGNRLDRYPALSEGIGGWVVEIHRVERGDRRAVVFEIVSRPAR